MDLLTIFCLGWFIGSLYANYQYLKAMRQIAKDQGMDLDEMAKTMMKQEERKIPVLVVEKQNEIIYLFDRNSNTFVAQGKTFEELAKKTLEYNKIPVALVVDGNKEFWFFNGEIKEGAI